LRNSEPILIRLAMGRSPGSRMAAAADVKPMEGQLTRF
jgi:hypothetical protein